MPITHKLRIDIEGAIIVDALFTLSTGDTNAYGLVLEFYQSGQFFDITGYNIAFFAKRTGSQIPIPDVGKVENGKGYYVIKPSMYAVEGTTLIEVLLSDAYGTSVVTKVLNFTVRGGFNSPSAFDEKDYDVLKELIRETQSATQDALNAIKYMENYKAITPITIVSTRGTQKEQQNVTDIIFDGTKEIYTAFNTLINRLKNEGQERFFVKFIGDFRLSASNTKNNVFIEPPENCHIDLTEAVFSSWYTFDGSTHDYYFTGKAFNIKNNYITINGGFFRDIPNGSSIFNTNPYFICNHSRFDNAPTVGVKGVNQVGNLLTTYGQMNFVDVPLLYGIAPFAYTIPPSPLQFSQFWFGTEAQLAAEGRYHNVVHITTEGNIYLGKEE